MKHIHACVLAALAFAFGVPAAAQPSNPDVRRAYDAIRPETVYAYCKTLCRPEYGGRYTGSASCTTCARWVASKFRQWGLRPCRTDGQYLQPFAAPHTIIDRAEATLDLPELRDKSVADRKPGVEAHDQSVPLKLGEEFMPLLFSEGGEASGALVFAGWAIHAPELGYDDYAGVDVSGKFVLCFRGTPDRSDHRFMEHDHHRARMRMAKRHGALGLVYIRNKIGANPNGEWIEGFFPLEVTTQIADRILAGQDVTCGALREQLEESKLPRSIPLQSCISVKVEARQFPDAVGYNVAAILPGTESKLNHACVVVGAHMDHCGRHAGMLFTGAQDNASGAAAVMAAAEAFSHLSKAPRRSVVLVLLGGEEMGLLGSTHFAKNLPVPFTKVHGMFNLDMVGAGDGTRYGCNHDNEDLRQTIEQADQIVKTLRGDPWLIRRVGVRSSDFAPFYLHGVPCANLSSNGPHLHYHQPGDTIYRINPDMLADVARLTFLAAHDWANR